MAEERLGSQEGTGRSRWLWTELFRGFWIAFDFNKLLLAAGGILMMAFGWWVLAIIFNAGKPEWNPSNYPDSNYSGKELEDRLDKAWTDFKQDRNRWAIRFDAAGNADSDETIEAGDIANTRQEYEFLVKYKSEQDKTKIEEAAQVLYPDQPGSANVTVRQKRKALLTNLEKVQREEKRKGGYLRTWPWSAERGPNPYLMVTGQTKRPWQAGHFGEWVISDRLPILLEPLYKLVAPIKYFLKPDIGFVNGLYFLLAMIWAIITWAIFGGAITRIAAVQIAQDEKITLGESIRYTTKRLFSYITAPLFPLVVVGFLLIVTMVFGLIHWVPGLGEVVDGLFWIVMILIGLAMALGLVGLIGWPLMSASISSDGADSWESVNRSYSYVFQAPWNYLWYTTVALAYGAIIAFFVGFMGSMTVYMGKWGMSQSPWLPQSREPSFLFVYAPESLGWRDLLLSGYRLEDGSYIVDPATGKIIPQNYNKYVGADESYNGSDKLTGINKFGAALVTFWITIFFLLILGFSYSYFWSAYTLIYFLLRRKVDEGEMDEIYFEEDEVGGYGGSLAPPSTPAGGPPQQGNESQSLTVVEAPSAPPAQESTPPPSPAPESTPEPTPEPEAEEPKAEEPPSPSEEPSAPSEEEPKAEDENKSDEEKNDQQNN